MVPSYFIIGIQSLQTRAKFEYSVFRSQKHIYKPFPESHHSKDKVIFSDIMLKAFVTSVIVGKLIRYECNKILR